MPSNLTPFYGLSQWAGTDRFLRADFNEDNHKIDTALANLNVKVQANPWELVTYFRAGSATENVSLSLENIDLSKYLYLMLYVDIVPGAYSDGYYYIRLNNVSSNTYYKVGTQDPRNYLMRTKVASGYSKNRILRFLTCENGIVVGGTYESLDGDDFGYNTVISDEVTWNTLTSIDYSSSSTGTAMKSGSGLYLYGIKKP